MTLYDAVKQVDFNRFKFNTLVIMDQSDIPFYEKSFSTNLHDGIVANSLNEIDHKLGNGCLPAEDKRSIYSWEATGTSFNLCSGVLSFTVVVPLDVNQQLLGGIKNG